MRYRGKTKREFLAEQMAQGGLAAKTIDGVFTDPPEAVDAAWSTWVGDRCPLCLGTGEVQTARGLHESPADARKRCPWCESEREHEAVNEPAPF